MNASSQAISPKLASKIAHLAVLFRAEFSNTTVDLSPWLVDEETSSQLDPNSIDLSFYIPEQFIGLACRCVFIQVYFSENLQCPDCQLEKIEVQGYSGKISPEQQWRFSTEDWVFEGVSTPEVDYQKRLKGLFGRMVKLFRRLNQVNSN